MASAVLSSRNEQYWGERQLYMRKYPNNSPNNTAFNSRFDLNPNPSPYPKPAQNVTPHSSFIRQRHNLIYKNHLQQRNEHPLMPPPPQAVNNSHLFYRKQEGTAVSKDQFHQSYVTFNLASYSGRELKQLKKRLISDLQRVRSLLTRIETWPPESRIGSHNLQLSPPSIEAGHHTLPPTEKQTPKGSQQKRPAGSVARKGKLNKKISGQKRANPFSSRQDKKKPTVMESVVVKVAGQMMRKCKQILMKLMKDDYGWVFSQPVDVELLGLHDYHDVIKNPMDLGTVKLRLDKKEYHTPLDFASDVRLTFENAMKYNPKGQDVHTVAKKFLLSFEQMFRPVYLKYEGERLKAIAEEQVKPNSSQPIIMMARDLPEPTPSTKESEVMPLQPTLMASLPLKGAIVPSHSSLQGDMEVAVSRSGKLPKPKAKNLIKRPMTVEEKLKLGLLLQNIPQDKMEQVVQILMRRNHPMSPQGGEIEIDIEALDSETLWELDSFVGCFKMAVNKMTKQEIENAALGKQVTEPLVSETPAEVTLQNSKKGDVGEEDVDIGEEIPANDFPPVEIEKDPVAAGSGSSSSDSSSSSSDESSSSSDSDSGNSSGSDSDEACVQSPLDEPGSDPAA